MGQILGKIMIPDSVSPTLDNAVELASRLQKTTKKLEVLELCKGAGISTMMTWAEIKKANPNKGCMVITVDIANESLLLAEILLKFKKFPVIRVNALEKTPKHFDGVVLLNLDASKIIEECANSGKKFDAVVSDHGIGYFENETHANIIRNFHNSLLDPGGIFSICSLENDVKVSLDYSRMIREILFGKNLLTRIPNTEVPYIIEERKNGVLIKTINSKESAGLYQMLQVLLHNGRISDFIGYIKTIARISKLTKTLSQEVKSPISFSHSLLSQSEIKPSPEQQKYSIARSLWFQKG